MVRFEVLIKVRIAAWWKTQEDVSLGVGLWRLLLESLLADIVVSLDKAEHNYHSFVPFLLTSFLNKKTVGVGRRRKVQVL